MAFLGASWSKVSRARLRAWRDSLRPLTVDIVGDFAGKERFAIHGEALVSHCISAARVDYGHGFQMLHAVHTIESFLKKLRDRGCNFEIVWFDSLKYLCIPYGTPEEHSYKYILTRAVLIQHFARRSPSHLSHRFDAVDCEEFRRYLTHNPLYFFMCSDGRAAHSDAHVTTLAHLSLGYRMSSLGYCVAFIDEISFGSSKVNISVATPTGRLPPIEKDHPLENGDQSTAIRDIVTTYALSCVLDSSATDARRKGAVCVLIQLVILRHCNLSQRSFAQSGHGLVGTNHAIFKQFCEAAIEIVGTGISEGLAATRWDGFDLVDGRLYLEIYNTASDLKLSGALRAEISELAISLEALTMVKISDLLPSCLPDATESSPEKLNSRVDSSVLPFSHPVVDQYLQQVQLETQEDPDPPHSQIFQELTHWHNAKKLIDPKHVSRAPGFFARKRNQKFMADTLSYSASLTGASGKKIDPEIIVVRKFGEEKTAKSTDALKDDWRAALKKQASAKNRKKVPKRGVVSGKQKALEEAQATRMAKDEAKSLAAAESWKDRLQEFENERSLIRRLHKAERHLYLSHLGIATS